tara:strand:+ start:295 stop:627 length:333 start_codon:yes stop_codon:yes gene_type:complete
MSRTRVSTAVYEKHQDKPDIFEQNIREELDMIEEAESKLKALASEKPVSSQEKTQYDADEKRLTSNVINVKIQEKRPITSINTEDEVDLVALSRSNYNKFMNRYDVDFTT